MKLLGLFPRWRKLSEFMKVLDERQAGLLRLQEALNELHDGLRRESTALGGWREEIIKRGKAMDEWERQLKQRQEFLSGWADTRLAVVGRSVPVGGVPSQRARDPADPPTEAEVDAWMRYRTKQEQKAMEELGATDEGPDLFERAGLGIGYGQAATLPAGVDPLPFHVTTGSGSGHPLPSRTADPDGPLVPRFPGPHPV